MCRFLLILGFLFLSNFLSLNAMLQDKEPSNLDDIKNLKSAYVVIPTMRFETENLTDYMISLKNGDIDQDSYEDLNLKDKLFLQQNLDLENKLLKLKSKLDSISQKQEAIVIENFCGGYNGDILKKEPNDLNIIFNKLNAFKKFHEDLQKKIDPLIRKEVERYRIQSYSRIEEYLQNIDKLIKSNKNNLYIIVFPEAFFNYFQHTSGFGNFIPFLDKKWMDIFLNSSKENENAVFIPNVIYEDKETSVRDFKNNFDTFIKQSYNQKMILQDYYQAQPDTSVVPIFNETFVFYKGKVQQNYKKQYILDEDIPMMKDDQGFSYLGKKSFLYVPGTDNQTMYKNFFNIEICQDHEKIDIRKVASKFLVVQSASININRELVDFYTGICIHSDIDGDKSTVYNISLKIKDYENVGNNNLKVYNLY